MTVDDRGGRGGVTSGDDVISSSRRPQSHGAGPKSPSPRSRRPLSPHLGLFIITLFQSVSADALKRPLPPPHPPLVCSRRLTRALSPLMAYLLSVTPVLLALLVKLKGEDARCCATLQKKSKSRMALEPYWCSAELQKAINPQHQVRIVKQSLRECFFFAPLC